MPNSRVDFNIMLEQQELLDLLQLVGMPVNYNDKIIIAKDCINEPDIYLHRSQPIEDDSGWYIGPLNKNINQDPQNFHSINIYQLFDVRPELLKVLALPPGYIAVYKDKELQSIANEFDEEVWKK
jgi:hypothetical protein